MHSAALSSLYHPSEAYALTLSSTSAQAAVLARPSGARPTVDLLGAVLYFYRSPRCLELDSRAGSWDLRPALAIDAAVRVLNSAAASGILGPGRPLRRR